MGVDFPVALPKHFFLSQHFSPFTKEHTFYCSIARRLVGRNFNCLHIEMRVLLRSGREEINRVTHLKFCQTGCITMYMYNLEALKQQFFKIVLIVAQL